MSKMNPEIKEKWLEALRGGKYLQTRGRLKDTQGGFCCLGVLCDVAGATWDDLIAYGPDDTNEDMGAFMLPFSISRVAKVSLETEGALADLNDKDKKPFTEIADWIEEHL